MTDSELNEMIKKAKSMINNNEIPDNVKNIVSSFNNNAQKQEPIQNNNANQNNNIDINNIMRLLNSIQDKSEDDMSKLLLSLKPYLRETKKEKIDEYIKLIQVGKMTKVMEDLNKNKGNKI